jgi:hypothetical protein
MTDRPETARPPTPRAHYRAYAAGALLLLLLFALFRGCVATKGRELVPPAKLEGGGVPAIPIVERVALPDGAVLSLEPGTLTHQLQRHLAGRDPAGRRFAFERLDFAPGSADIPTADRPTIDVLARLLRAYPKARIGIVGHPDARNIAPDLARRRAGAVAAALATAGIAPARVALVADAAAPAPTPGGAASRPTELVVTAK